MKYLGLIRYLNSPCPLQKKSFRTQCPRQLACLQGMLRGHALERRSFDGEPGARVNIEIYMYVSTYLSLYIYVYIYVCMYMCVCVYIYIYISSPVSRRCCAATHWRGVASTASQA